MFGLGTLFTRSTSKDTVKSSVSSPSPIMIGDFVGTYSNDNPTITPTSLLYSSPSGIITLELLQNYNNKNFQLDKIYNNGIIGKCDGEFPVTNPVKNNVYYYSVDKKYYRCKNGSTSVIDTPDDNFEEISLYNLSLNGVGGSSISSIEITGDVNGTGILDDGSDVINITSSLSNMSKYVKSSYSAITTSDTPITAIAKLEGGLDNKANTSGSYPNLTVGTANKVLNSLTLSLNGESQTAFNGNAAVMIDITAEKIGAAASNHDHSGVYQPVGNYSVVGHKHTKSEITDMPTTLPNPNALTLKVGSVSHSYTGSSATSIDITTESIGAQPKGDYALSSHNHSGVYAPVSHTHTIDQIGKLTGYAKASSAAAIDVTDTILIALGKLEKSLDGKQASGSYAASSHTHTKSQITDFPTSMKNPNAITISLNGTSQGAYDGSAALSINITPASIGAQAAGSYAAASHTHAWDAISGKPSTFTPAGHNQASSTITAMTGYAKASAVAAIAATDSLNVAIGKLEKALDSKQAAGSYASSSHNHDSVYAKTSHGNHVPATQTASNKVFLRNDNTWQTITPANIGAAAASHTHAYLPTSGGTISGALTVTGQILSNADVVAYSDARFKTNLQVIDNPVNKILSINGYKYDMLGVDNSRQVGVIAQEIEEILPEAVYKDQNGHLGVRYTNLIPLLIEGFKQQQKEIQLLKRQLGMEV